MQTTIEETKLAYADCNLEVHEGLPLRNLHFRSTKSVNAQDAEKIMKTAIPNGYNNFDANVLSKFPDDCQIYLAREGSVCIYLCCSR